MSRVLPNLQAKPYRFAPILQKTFGLEPHFWWLLFRRDLQANHNIRRMNAKRWAQALELGTHRKLRPHKAAALIAAL